MIDNPPLLTINRHFARPTEAAIESLKAVPTGFIVDALNGRGALDFRIKPLEEDRATVTGVAVTCDNGPDDNLALLGSLLVVRPGDVIVAATGGFLGSAVTGDLVIGMAKNNGVSGFVTDGLIRDTDGIRAVKMPVFSRGVTPNSPVRNGPGTVGLPINLGGREVRSGDVLVTDKDGVVVVPQDQIASVIARVKEIQAAEADLDLQVRNGLKQPPYLEEMIAAGQVKELPG